MAQALLVAVGDLMATEERPGNRRSMGQHRERAARQWQRHVPGLQTCPRLASLGRSPSPTLTATGRATWSPFNTDNTASVLLGNGNGTFQALQSYGTGASLCQLRWRILTATGRRTWSPRTGAATPRACCSATATGRFRPSSRMAREPTPRSCDGRLQWRWQK